MHMSDETKPTESTEESQSMWLRTERADASPSAKPTANVEPSATDASALAPAPSAEAVWAAARASHAEAPAPRVARPLLSSVIDERDDGDSTYFFGRIIPMPMYTVIFGTLAVITLIEVVISELPEGFLGTLSLVVLSLAKAVLVILFYMHLRNDSRIFAVALILPLIIGLISAMFLLAVPTTGYPY
jgi:caa(3)-type oxidase subunit IV